MVVLTSTSNSKQKPKASIVPALRRTLGRRMKRKEGRRRELRKAKERSMDLNPNERLGREKWREVPMCPAYVNDLLSQN